MDRFDIYVTVINGTVYLGGTVDTYFEKGLADDVAAKTLGVSSVVNNIDVMNVSYPLAYDPYLFDYFFYDERWYDYRPYQSFKSDLKIEREIIDELFWSPFVDSGDVEVDVEDGVATLTGEVDTWSEYRAAANNAYEGGAVWVDNDLKVE